MMRKLQHLPNKFKSSKHAPKWLACLSINLVIGGYFSAALVAPASNIKTAWLPGKTTHGHYQIELDCNACHDPSSSSDSHDASNVMQDACIRCHGDQLKQIDTHPAKKFNDPTNAELLATLDAQDCLSCHAEHVPHQTLAMGLTMPSDYCWHCHDDVADSRPSHEGMAFDSCATAGCHNYHDNSALYEKFLNDHFGEPDHLEAAVNLLRDTSSNLSTNQWPKSPLSLSQADHPNNVDANPELLADWAETAHASAGVNCTDCHIPSEPVSEGQQSPEAASPEWSDVVSLDTCGTCHDRQVGTFLTGKHGMRLGAGLSPMTPSLARLPMHSDAAHRQLDCSACHDGHRFDTDFASTDSCLRCHNDDHSLAYAESSHAVLWRDEVLEKTAAGTGVSCATCHMPRLKDDDGVWVSHDQNSNLRPNEKMAREVCLNCHGLEFSLSALADQELIRRCFGSSPESRVESVQMARQWFDEKERKRAGNQRRP